MLSDRHALLAAIRANPEEDTPRLMFADWLDENGEPERAEFTRLQCELARLADDGSDSQPVYEFLRDRDFVTRPSADWTRIDDGIHRRLALSMRADDLLKRHGDGWLPKLPKTYQVRWNGFHRGFPHRVVIDQPRRLKAIAARLRELVPAVTLVSDKFTARAVEQLADAGMLGRVCGLELHGDYAAGLREFGLRAEAAAVRTLKVGWYGNVGDVLAALADSPHWAGLRALDLSELHVEADAAEALFRAPHMRGLKRLDVRGYHWTADTVRAFAAAAFAELTALRFTRCWLDDDAAEALAACPHLARLRTLDFPHNRFTGRGVTALLASPHLTNVAFLGLEDNPVGGLDGKRLADAAPGALRMLHCHGSRLVTADVRKLARCPRLRTLWYLDLDDTGIGTPAVRELVQGFGKWCPPVVWLTHNRIDDRGAVLLARWKAATALRVLHLRYNDRITDVGVRALLDSPRLAGLDGLGVSTESEGLIARLRARFRHHDIEY